MSYKIVVGLCSVM